MWYNGFQLVISRALDVLGEPALLPYRKTLTLGAFREDVWYFSGLRFLVENPSLSHFVSPSWRGGFFPLVPGAASRAERLFARARRAYEEGRLMRAFVLLGRASHLVIDMSCPVHAQAVAHGSDPFEWCVEAMIPKLKGLPVPPLPEGESARALVLGMARLGQSVPADKTNSAWGRVLRRLGRRRPVRAREVREQAEMLIPAAISYTAALFRLFSLNCPVEGGRGEGEILKETLLSLDMPPAALRRWFLRLKGFGFAHGARRYADLIALSDECLSLLEPYLAKPGRGRL